MRISELKIKSFLFRNPQSTFRILGSAILKLIKSKIDAFLGHQFRMGSGFPNPPFMENDDPISMLDSGKPVSDDNGCPSLE
jgi:hypothetical protein